MARKSSYASGLSVQNFQQLMDRIPVEVGLALQEAVATEANEMVAAMKAAAPVKTGNLRESIRANLSSKSPLRVIIRAGGPLTTKEVRAGSGVAYDYALGTEWGTQKESPHPFFYSTARAKKPAAQRRISQKAKSALGKVVEIK